MVRGSGRISYAEPAEDGSVQYWHMPTLWRAAAGMPETQVQLEELAVLDDVVWFGGPKNVKPTIRIIVEHIHDILNADMSYPIIMTKSGDVMDGAHRVARAHLEGKPFIRAVIIDQLPEPDGVLSKDEAFVRL